MLLAVVGGTGTAGRPVVREALDRGHSVRVISRGKRSTNLPAGAESREADLVSGTGLTDALAGVEVVIDCGNAARMTTRVLKPYFEGGTTNLMAAEVAAGVRRHVLLSIVGIDKVSSPYYRAKLAQERISLAAATPVVVVRSTQFHDLAGQLLSQLKLGPFVFIPSLPIQPVATEVVARVLLDTAESPAPAALTQIGGPKEEALVRLARLTAAARGKGKVIPLWIPGRGGRASRAGGLLLPGGPTAGPDFETWLAMRPR